MKIGYLFLFSYSMKRLNKKKRSQNSTKCERLEKIYMIDTWYLRVCIHMNITCDSF